MSGVIIGGSLINPDDIVNKLAQAFKTWANEDLDDADLFGTQPVGHRLPPGHKFVIYINNQPRGKAADLEHAVDRSERYLEAVKASNPEAPVNIQIVDDHDGEVMWSGGSWTGGARYYRGGASKYKNP